MNSLAFQGRIESLAWRFEAPQIVNGSEDTAKKCNFVCEPLMKLQTAGVYAAEDSGIT